MASAFDVLNLIFALLGLTGLGQLAWNYIYGYLPLEQLKTLDEIFDETDALYHAGIEDGLLPNSEEIEQDLIK
jgi:hypothetical protein